MPGAGGGAAGLCTGDPSTRLMAAQGLAAAWVPLQVRGAWPLSFTKWGSKETTSYLSFYNKDSRLLGSND